MTFDWFWDHARAIIVALMVLVVVAVLALVLTQSSAPATTPYQAQMKFCAQFTETTPIESKTYEDCVTVADDIWERTNDKTVRIGSDCGNACGIHPYRTPRSNTPSTTLVERTP